MRGNYLGIAVAALVGTANPAEAKWLRADTANFIIYSEGNEQSLRDFAEKAERLDATLRSRFNARREPEENRLTIYLLPKSEDVARMNSGKRNGNAAGFYAIHPEGTFAVSNREPDVGRNWLDGQTVLFHEYAQHFMLRYAPRAYPAWFVEGFAEYYATVDFTKQGHAQIGKPAHHRAYGLLEMPKMPVRTLLATRPSELKDGAQVEIFYGRAWLLTHMLYSSEERAGQLTKYIGAINAGAEQEQAATDAFGDLDQLDKDLNRYLSRPLAYRTTSQPIAIVGDITIRPLTVAEDLLMPLRMERLGAHGESERLIKLRAAHSKAETRLSGDAAYWYERAALEWDLPEDQRDAVMLKSGLERALALNADHVHANVLTGLVLAEELDAKSDFSAVAWRAVRQPITRANRLAPNDPWPLYSWYNSFQMQGVTPPDIAHQGLARAFQLAPENVSVRFSYAFDLARKGDFDPAIALAKTIAFDPHGGGQGRQLIAQLEAMRDDKAGVDTESKSAADD